MPQLQTSNGKSTRDALAHRPSVQRSPKRKFGAVWTRVFNKANTKKRIMRNPDLLAILSMAFGIGSVVLPFLGFLLAVAAIVLGVIALRRGQRRPFAIVGIVLGSLVALFYLAYFATFIWLILLFW